MAAKKTKAIAKQRTSKRLAAKVLATLPALDADCRAAYRAAFSDAQCEAWAAQTKADAVLAEAERALGAVHARLRRGPLGGYSLRRLAWLCELMVALESAVAEQRAAEKTEARARRDAAVDTAVRARRRLVVALQSMAGGDEGRRRLIAAHNDASKTPQVLVSTVTGLVELARAWRREQLGAVLAEDAGLTDDVLAALADAALALREATEATFGGEVNDSADTARVEGRVLRELGFLRRCLEGARELGDAVPAFPPLRSLARVEGRGGSPDRPEATP